MSKPENTRKVLGKGLNQLLPSRPTVAAAAPPPEPAPPAHEDAAQDIPIASIDPNPLQPRRVFAPEKLEELAQSIRANGIVQPLVVRKVGDRYQLVAGERRLRAAKEAGFEMVPVVIRDIPDERLLEITLIENIQREDLNPIETATAFQKMSSDLFMSPDEIGRRTGKDRSTITNYARLLQLPKDIQDHVAERRLTAGHARCLLALPSRELQRDIAHKAVTQAWSVRQMERVTQKLLEPKQETPEPAPMDPNVKAAIAEMQRVLGTKVRLVEKARSGGRIEIEYYSSEDLDRIYALITGQQ